MSISESCREQLKRMQRVNELTLTLQQRELYAYLRPIVNTLTDGELLREIMELTEIEAE